MSAQYFENTWVPQGHIYSTEGRQPGPLHSLLTTSRGRKQKWVLLSRNGSHLMLGTRHQFRG